MFYQYQSTRDTHPSKPSPTQDPKPVIIDEQECYKLVTRNGHTLFFDINDWEILKEYTWTVKPFMKKITSRLHYNVSACVVDTITGKNTFIMMARLLCNLPKGDKRQVVHKNGNALDHRRCNLCLTNYGQRNAHSRVKITKSKSRFKGVGPLTDGSINKWIAKIKYNGKNLTVARCDSEVEAAIAYNKKAKELYGDCAFLNRIGD